MEIAAPMNVMRIIEMVLVLLTGPSGDDIEASRIQRATYPEKAAIYAHFDLSELRKQIFKNKELKAAIFQKKDAQMVFKSQLSTLSKQINVKEEALLKVLSSARGIGFWMDAKPKPNQVPKGLIVVDFGKTSFGLMEIMKIHAKLLRLKHSAMEEDGVSVNCFQEEHGDDMIYAVVRDGMLALALDPKSVLSFMKAKKVEPKKKEEGADEFFTIATTGSDIADMIRAAVPGDRKEANLVIGILDLVSYKSITGTASIDKLSVTVDLDPNGAAARILKPAKRNRLVSAFPAKDFIGYFLSLDKPLDLWQFIKGQLSMHLGNDFQFVDQVLASMKREIGIDLEVDLLPTIQGYYHFFVINSLVFNDNPGMVFGFHFNEAASAKKNLDTLMKAPQLAEEMMKAKLKGNDVFRQKDKDESPIIARKGPTVMLAGEMGHNNNPEPIGLAGLESLDRLGKATKDQPAIAGLNVSLDQMLGRDLPDVTASMTREKNRINVTLKTEYAPFATWLLSGKPLFAHEAPKNKGRLVRLYGEIKEQVEKTGGTFPKDKWRLRNSYRSFQAWVNPNTGATRSFMYVGGIGKNTPNKGKVFLLYDPQPFDGKRNVVYLDGGVKTLTEKAFKEEMKKQSDLKNGLICDLPEAQRQKVRDLCKKLGDNSFKVRREARKQLEAMGGSILPILREFETNKDPEIKMSVKKLIKKYKPEEPKRAPIPKEAW